MRKLWSLKNTIPLENTLVHIVVKLEKVMDLWDTT